MSRRELHSDDTAIEQRPVVTDPADRDGEVILVDSSLASKNLLDELAFMDEPVTIRLEPSTERNAVATFAVWVNGLGAEVLHNGRWFAIGYLPVGEEITIKRKVLEVIARTKIDTIDTDIREKDSDRPINNIIRRTSAVHAFSVIEDNSKRGAAWMRDLRRRNF